MERDKGGSSRRQAYRESASARAETLRAESKGSKARRERQQRDERKQRHRSRSRSRSRSLSSRSHSRSSRRSESPDGHGRDRRKKKKRSRSTRSPSASSEDHFQESSKKHRRRESFDSERVREAHSGAREAASRARDRPMKETKFGRKQDSGRKGITNHAARSTKKAETPQVRRASFSIHALERNLRGKLEKIGEKEGLLVEVREPSPGLSRLPPWRALPLPPLHQPCCTSGPCPCPRSTSPAAHRLHTPLSMNCPRPALRRRPCGCEPLRGPGTPPPSSAGRTSRPKSPSVSGCRSS